MSHPILYEVIGDLPEPYYEFGETYRSVSGLFTAHSLEDGMHLSGVRKARREIKKLVKLGVIRKWPGPTPEQIKARKVLADNYKNWMAKQT